MCLCCIKAFSLLYYSLLWAKVYFFVHSGYRHPKLASWYILIRPTGVCLGLK